MKPQTPLNVVLDDAPESGTAKRFQKELSQMSCLYERLFEGNRQFVEETTQHDPEFFHRLSEGQHPKYLLIGCSDSRVPPDRLTKTEPGEIFIHRNVANLVVNTDLNFMSVLQYAVEVLQVKHVIVLGHYCCGGIKAAMDHSYHGLIDKWLRNIKDVIRLHKEELDAVTEEEAKLRLLVELNIKEQVLNLCKTSIIQKQWANGNCFPMVHGLVYDIRSGYLKDLKISSKEWASIESIYHIDFPHLNSLHGSHSLRSIAMHDSDSDDESEEKEKVIITTKSEAKSPSVKSVKFANPPSIMSRMVSIVLTVVILLFSVVLFA